MDGKLAVYFILSRVSVVNEAGTTYYVCCSMQRILYNTIQYNVNRIDELPLRICHKTGLHAVIGGEIMKNMYSQFGKFRINGATQ